MMSCGPVRRNSFSSCHSKVESDPTFNERRRSLSVLLTLVVLATAVIPEALKFEAKAFPESADCPTCLGQYASKSSYEVDGWLVTPSPQKRIGKLSRSKSEREKRRQPTIALLDAMRACK